MDQHLALAGKSFQHFQHAAGPALRQVAHLAAQALSDFAQTHLVVAPQGAVQQQAIGARHPGQHLIVDLPKARCVEQRGAAVLVFDEQTNGVARLRVAAMG
ncbi:hypothetical protein D3C76_917730 [compost metagenome]